MFLITAALVAAPVPVRAEPPLQARIAVRIGRAASIRNGVSLDGKPLRETRIFDSDGRKILARLAEYE